MAKKRKYRKRKKRERAHQIDHIPKYCQQRRSPGGPKRRTDFSLFFRSSSSSPSNATLHEDSLLELPDSKEILSTFTIASLDKTKDMRKEVLGLPQVRCIESQDKRQGLFSKFVELPAMENKSVAQDAHFEPWAKRNVDKQRSDTIKTLQFTLDKSQITESNDVCNAPGSVVWAKTACQLWWPAEILGERSTSVDSSYQGIDGQVLVQYCGNHESAWVDPATDLSQFEDCFEERSCYPMKEFQDALKQALHRRENLNACKQFIGSLDAPNCLNPPDQLPDKWNLSSSSRSKTDCLERGRSKRERKPKVHFDEVTFPLKSARKVRRFRIMRFLGLAAPIGSPFSLTPHEDIGLAL